MQAAARKRQDLERAKQSECWNCGEQGYLASKCKKSKQKNKGKGSNDKSFVLGFEALGPASPFHENALNSSNLPSTREDLAVP